MMKKLRNANSWAKLTGEPAAHCLIMLNERIRADLKEEVKGFDEWVGVIFANEYELAPNVGLAAWQAIKAENLFRLGAKLLRSDLLMGRLPRRWIKKVNELSADNSQKFVADLAGDVEPDWGDDAPASLAVNVGHVDPEKDDQGEAKPNLSGPYKVSEHYSVYQPKQVFNEPKDRPEPTEVQSELVNLVEVMADVFASAEPEPYDVPLWDILVSRMPEVQRQLRRTGVTASEMAALGRHNPETGEWLSDHPFRSPLDVYAHKVHGTEVKEITEAMEMGSALEPLVLARYLHDHERGKLVKAQTIRSRRNQWMIATPDLINVLPSGTMGIEAKTTGYWDEPPAYVVDQVHGQWEACLTHGYELPDFWHVPVFQAKWGLRYKLFEVPLSEEHMTYLVGQVERFWMDHVMKRVPPKCDPTRHADLAKAYPRNLTDIMLKADDDCERWLGLLRETFIPQGRLTQKGKDKIYGLIRDKIGEDFAGLEFADGHNMSWKNNRDGEKTDWETAFHELAGMSINSHDGPCEGVIDEIIEMHTKTVKGNRPFLAKEKQLLPLDE